MTAFEFCCFVIVVGPIAIAAGLIWKTLFIMALFVWFTLWVEGREWN